jgi:membrane protein
MNLRKIIAPYNARLNTSTHKDMMKTFAKNTLLATLCAAAFSTAAWAEISVNPMKGVKTVQVTNKWDKTFKLDANVEHQKVQFKNRYGITVVGDLYLPKNAQGKLPTIVLSGPFGAVKEQSSGLHAHEMAKRGFVALAFDPSFTGESGGEVRDVASPEIFTEDFSAAVDFLGLQPFVDREKIGVLAVCGLTGMGLTAATADSRIKAVALTAMYDMSRSISQGHQDYYTPEQRAKLVDHISQQRWQDAENGTFARGWHELGFDDKGNVMTGESLFPKEGALPAGMPEFVYRFYDYYKTPRGYHARSINSNSAWTATTPMAFFEFKLMDNLDKYHRPLLLVTGEKAHSRYYSETVYKKANQPKEIVVVKDADHVDLYDNFDKIPFDKFAQFFKANLK